MTLLAHYPLNGTADDVGGYGLHGTPTNVSWVAGKIGRAASFNGSSSYISIPGDIPSSYLGNLTIAFWANVTDKGSGLNQHLVSKSDSMAVGLWEYLLVAKDGGDYYTPRWYHVNGTADVLDFSTHVPYGEWHHITGVRDSSQTKIAYYVDGVLDASGWQSYSTSHIPNLGANTLKLGATISDKYLLGLLDDVRVYDEVLTIGQIQELFSGDKGSEECQPWQRLMQRAMRPTIQHLIGAA